MARNPTNTAVLQITPGYLAYTRATPLPGGGFSVIDSGTEYGAWKSEDGSLGKALKEFVQRHELGEDRIFLVLPRHEAAARILDLPARDPEELRGMVHFGAEEIVPFPLEELLTSYCVLDSLPENSSRVLAVVVRKAVVESLIDIASGAGLRVEQILFSTACLLTGLSQLKLPAATAALHVSPDGFEVAVLRDGKMAFGRGLAQPVAAGPGTVDPQAIEDLATELRNSLSAYRRDSADSERASQIMLSATGLDGGAIAGPLEAALGIPVTGVQDCVTEGALKAAFGDRTHRIALMPETELRRRAAAGTRSRLVRLGVAAAVAFVATAALYAQTVIQRQAYIRELDARAEELRPVARTLLAKRHQLRLIEERVARSLSPILALSEIAAIAPDEGVNFNRLSFEHDEGIVVSGSATSPALFDGVIDGIRGVGASTFSQFARARELYRTERVERNERVWDFAITIPFSEEDAP